jgi:hypothetical protein
VLLLPLLLGYLQQHLVLSHQPPLWSSHTRQLQQMQQLQQAAT